jgi:hypothetical protein
MLWDDLFLISFIHMLFLLYLLYILIPCLLYSIEVRKHSDE